MGCKLEPTRTYKLEDTMKFLLAALCIFFFGVFSYIMYMITRSVTFCIIALAALFVLFAKAWVSEKEDILGLLKSNKKPEPADNTPEEESLEETTESKPGEKDITSFSDSMVVSNRTRGTVSVGIMAKAVKEFEKNTKVAKDLVPVYMACKALNLDDATIERIINSHDGFKVNSLKASEREITKHWGKEQIYYVQIMVDYISSGKIT